MELTKNIILDIDNSVYTSIEAKQNDTLSRFIQFTLVNKGIPLNLLNHTVKIFGAKQDNTLIFNDVEIVDSAAGIIKVELTNQALAVPGILICELVIYGQDSSVLSSKPFNISVTKSLRDDSAIESTNEFTALTQGIAKLDAWDSQFQTKYDGLEAQYATYLTEVKSDLADIAVNVKSFGAKGDGVTDDTLAIQAALDTLKPIKIPVGTYLVTDSLKIYQNTIIIGNENPSLNYSLSKTKIDFKPTVKKDLFVWKVTPTDYRYGVRIQGLSITSSNSNGNYAFNIPYANGLRVNDVRVYSGFNYGAYIGSYIDALFTHCSFMGITHSCLYVYKAGYICTSTTFRNCYFSYADKGFEVESDAINSLYFDDCIFESMNMICDIGTNNNVYMNNIYTENIPVADDGHAAIRLGKTGDMTAYKCGSFVYNGKTSMGISTGPIPTTNYFMEVGYWKNVSISNTYILRQGILLKTTVDTDQVQFNNVYVENVGLFAGNGDIYDWSKIIINGGNFINMYKSLSDTVKTSYQDMKSEIFFNSKNSIDVSYGKVFLDKNDKRLKYKDTKNNLRNMSFLSAPNASTTFNGMKLQAGEIIWNNTNNPVAKGQPLGWINRWFSRDTQAAIYDGVTTSGSAVITSASGTFWDFEVNDYVLVLSGMPSTAIQYKILSISSDKKSITLDTNASSNQTGVTVYVPVHNLLPFGQIDYRTSAGAPSLTPYFVGEEVLDNTNKVWYKAVGLNTTDWKLMT